MGGETENGIIYGQNFLTRSAMESQFSDFELVPLVEFELGDMSHKVVLENLKKFIPTTNVALSENALKGRKALFCVMKVGLKLSKFDLKIMNELCVKVSQNGKVFVRGGFSSTIVSTRTMFIESTKA